MMADRGKSKVMDADMSSATQRFSGRPWPHSIHPLGQTARESITAKIGRLLSPLLLMGVDYLSIIISLALTFYMRNEVLPSFLGFPSGFGVPRSYVFVLIPGVYILLLSYAGMYTKRSPLWQKIEILFKVSFFATLLIMGLLFVGHVADQISRTFLMLSSIICFVTLTVVRYFAKRFLFFVGLWTKPVIIVGAGETAELVAQAYQADPSMGYRIVGVIEDEVPAPNMRIFPVLGGFADAERVIEMTGVKDIIVAAPGLERDDLVRLVCRIQPLVKSLNVIPDLFGLPVTNLQAESFFGQRTVLLGIKNNLNNRLNRFTKYTFDMLCCIMGAVVLVPIFLIISLLIFIDSPGPVIFAHRRLRNKGKEFNCYKFRTMVLDAETALERHLAESPDAREEWERDHKLKDDPRITRFGRFLRKTSLDELPQLINVIKGEMSLVGPRPIVRAEVPKYGELINDYYLVRPGLTGYWQISGRNDISYDTRVAMDSWYVRNWSFWLDIDIILKTFKVVLKKDGAY